MLLIRTIIFTLIAPVMVMLVVPYLIAQRVSALHFDLGGFRYAGLILVAFGSLDYLWCAADFMRARGTPAPIDPPRELVVRGLYHYTRNPMYVGVITGIAGMALLYGSGALLVYGLIGFGIVHLFVTQYEEPHLRKAFGAAYEDYCRTVPRWIPRISPGES